MCGIAGVISREPMVGNDLVREMLSAIGHRGPDDSGVEVMEGGRVTLGNVRLAVLDLSPGGHQPMWTADRSACIAYNGEIYNFRELRKDLERVGHRFVSQSDTEVILAGYREWGAGVCDRLNGMFAFAIWDALEHRLLVVRDRLGKKPFYYWHKDDVFVFASEIKGILRHQRVARTVDPEALQCYLALGYSPAPLTMFSDVCKLPAGHLAILKPGGQLELQRFWRPPTARSDVPPGAELRRQIRTEIEAAVERRLISDVPLGAFLSGGVDSSIVVGIMSRLIDAPVRTFSTAFEVGARSFKYNVDADAAARVAKHFGTEHTEIRITEEQVVASARAVAWTLDEPITTPMFQTYLLAREVKRHGVTVVLSGDGSDEVFGGYSRYLNNRVVDALGRLPSTAIRALSQVAGITKRGAGIARAADKALTGSLSAARYMSWWEYLHEDVRTTLTTPGVALYAAAPTAHVERLIRESGVRSSTDLVAYLDLLLWIAEDSNMRMDKLCMAASLESRAPFLDYHVVELGLSIPFERKASWTTGKRLLRDAFSDLLPAEVMQRPKWGWMGPIYHWMRGPLGEQARACLAALPRTGFFSDAVVSFDRQVPPPEPMLVWKLMLWALWYDTYIESIGLREAA
jgi:asparagine synthase (glutamine-hydrolysing)